jgi:DNA-binding transcriptional LysR family regulator
VPELIRGTDLLAVIGEHAVETIVRREDFAVLPLPIELPDLAFGMIWHRRSQEDAGHRWLRTMIAKAFAADTY